MLMYKLRIKFAKRKEAKYISHLDLMRLIQRAFRRANIPVEYTKGFNPHPKLSLAIASPLGMDSDGEYMDVELTEKIEVKDFIKDMNMVLPYGISMIKARYVTDKKSLVSMIEWSSYIMEIEFENEIEPEDIKSLVSDILSRDEIIITKEKKKRNKIVKKSSNIREYIKEIELLLCEENKIALKLLLKTGSRGNLKPEALIPVFEGIINREIKKENVKVKRMELYVQRDGNIVAPI